MKRPSLRMVTGTAAACAGVVLIILAGRWWNQHAVWGDRINPREFWKNRVIWKITYLRRLRREKVDESYINAYLKAWNISAAEIADESLRP